MTAIRRPGVVIAAFLVLLVGAAFLTQVIPYRQIIESNNKVESARSELQRLEAENTELMLEVDALHTDSEVEKLAREKLGYVWPGEEAYVVVVPPGSEEAPPVVESESEPEPTWVDRVWDFLTGADLSE